jgi:hypothetical protein
MIMIQRCCLIAALLGLPSTLLFAQQIRPRNLNALSASGPTVVQKYDSKPLQFGELRLPPQGKLISIRHKFPQLLG